MLKIFDLFHKNKRHIGINFTGGQTIKSKLLTLDNISYTATHTCYYIPYSIQDYAALRALNIPYTIITSGTAEASPSLSDNSTIEVKASTLETPKPEITQLDSSISLGKAHIPAISWSGKAFITNISYELEAVTFLKSLKGSYWHSENKVWVVKSNIENLKSLQNYFAGWTEEEYLKLFELINLQMNPRIIEIYLSPERIKFIYVKLRGFGIDVSFIKTFAHREYDKEFKRWILPLEKETIKKITDHYEKLGVKIINRIPKKDIGEYYVANRSIKSKLSYLLSKFPSSFPEILAKYVDVMLLQNYSWRTIQSYTGKMAKFMAHYGDISIATLEADEVNKYLTKIAQTGVSESLINITLSAIKFYYEKVEYRSNFHIERLVRPKKGKYLPTILSEVEVDRIFRSMSNLKHLCIAYTIYGGGLRLNEVLNIRVQDIIWDRNQIILKQAKGNKDRMTLLSHTLKELMKRYIEEYQPEYWLFEGLNRKTAYSSSSVQKIIKESAKKAGIKRKVTPHTLRHCFATHLLDRGTDIRFIQELLGHKDIKTTLVYTHVTTRSMDNIQSPLDRLGKNITEL
ncbi:tyrosine-type recombinase/integrase [Portibacter lacus]|uniref:Recombinase n=1 Tax=Portibacter lacus TaxID=1099794 RepID=A0AA37SKC6_9BACT|nr:tyrosine-type recombinase/integrase [Portibacter lacus]GLR16148.1 hypothetical protein GCM10007940_07630 [Portibacter lacus]